VCMPMANTVKRLLGAFNSGPVKSSIASCDITSFSGRRQRVSVCVTKRRMRPVASQKCELAASFPCFFLPFFLLFPFSYVFFFFSPLPYRPFLLPSLLSFVFTPEKFVESTVVRR